MKDCTILTCGFSDHDFVLVDLDNFDNYIRKGGGFWKFNSLLLRDSDF